MMKHIHLIIYIAVLTVLAACSETQYDETRIPSLNRRYINVSTSKLSFPSTSSRDIIHITSSDALKIKSKPDWLTLIQISSEESLTLLASVEDNNTIEPKQGILLISTTDKVITKSIEVTQDCKYEREELQSLELNYSGGTNFISLPLKTDEKWSLIKDGSWFMVNKTSGTGYAHIVVSTQFFNTSGLTRFGKITLVTAEKIYIIPVYQPSSPLVK